MREKAIVREIAAHDLYCCLLPQCEALRTCRSGFPIATQPSAVQNLLSTWTYRSVLIVTDRSMSSSKQNGPMMQCLEMATQAVHFTECNGLCRQCSGGCATPEDVVLRVHVIGQQKMCLVRKPDIVKKVWHSVNLVAKPLAHDHSLPHVVRCKPMFNLYPVMIHVEICDQNSQHGLPVNSKLLTSPRRRLAWAVDNRVSDSSNVMWCPRWIRSSRVWLSVSVFMIAVIHSPMGSELVDPSVDYWVDRKFTTSEPFVELQLSCVDRLLPKIRLNYKYLLLSSPWHLEGQIW